jgi:two-component system chemotaxis sensor kinase CheA
VAPDPYRYFRVEARELADELGRGLLSLEKGQLSEIVPRLLRLAHTLKGAARVVKHVQIAEHTHAMESALGRLRDRPVASAHEVDALLKLLDGISACVAELEQPAAAARPAAAPGAGEEPLRTVRADVAEMDMLLDGLSEASVQLGAMRGALGALERMRQLIESLIARLGVARARELPRAGDGALASSVRSTAEELQRLAERLEQGAGAALDQTERELQQVRDAAERLRLLPADALAGPLERTARDVAQSLGKSVAFSFKGGDVRLDAHVLGQVQPALVQMVRNAVAHGIEPPDERARARKPALGQVEVVVVRRANRVAFVCRDDGRGVDLEALRQVAREAGGSAADAAALGEAELLALLMKGGLTTSRTVTELSGRGIGLDIVRETAARLAGETALHSEPHRGTRLELVVPVSVSSLDALLVEAGGLAVAIPLAAIQRTLRLLARDVARTPSGDSIVHEGQVIPFVPLHRPLRVPARPASGAWSTVVVRAASAQAALGVDRLLGTTNVVVRPLPALALADPVVAGAALDAAGTPRLVLDPERLIAMASGASGGQAEPAPAPGAPILIIDDSLTTRMLEQSILESAGYEVELASSAEEGFDKALRRRYGLFLVDVEMPGMDGFTFVEKTRADPLLRDVPAILVSSRNAPEDLARGRAAGAHAYVVKAEFDQGRLLETIRGLLSS